MKRQSRRLTKTIALAGGLAMAGSAVADTTITTFDDFTSDALYASWVSATIVSGPTAYTVTATNYGSNWKYNPLSAAGETTIELSVTLDSSSTNAGSLGPIVTLVDADGTSFNYAWFGQLNGSHVLTMPVTSPTWIGAPGTAAGLDLATLTHLHMQVDPSDYHDGYTIAWENLRLTGAPPPVITSQSYDPATSSLTLTWTSLPGKLYTILYAPDLSTMLYPWLTDLTAEGTSTTTTVPLTPGPTGFVRVQQQ
jgi:hypothetical protein